MSSLATSSRLTGRRKLLPRQRREALIAYAFLSLNLIGVVTFALGPVVAGFGLSFTEWNLLKPPALVGAANYIELVLEDPLFILSLRNTLYYSVLAIPLSIVVSLTLALLLNQEIGGI